MQVKKQLIKKELDIEEWTDSNLGEEYFKVVYCHLLYLCAEYIIRNAVLDESQAGIKIAGKNINNFRYAVDTTLMSGSKEELKSLLMKLKEDSEKAEKLSIQKMKIMASGAFT